MNNRFLLLPLVAAAMCLFTNSANAQAFHIPEKYVFNTVDDYHRYDKDILKTIKWIEATAPGEDPQRMKLASRFLLEWLSGCPYVRLTPNIRIESIFGDSRDLRIYYVAGWVKYALKDGGAKPDKAQCAEAGIRAAIKMYRSISRNSDPNMEEVSKVERQGKLKNWVQERM